MSAPVAFGSQFTISTQNANSQGQTSVTALRDGRIVVTWQDWGSNSGDIKMRIVNPTSGFAGTERTVNVSTTGTQEAAQVTWLATGGFVVTWEDTNAPTGGGDIRYRVYNAAGTAITSERTAHVNTASAQDRPSVVATGDGGFLIGWADGNLATTGLSSSTGAMLRRFDATGAAVGTAVRISGDWGGDFTPALAVSRNLTTFGAVWDDNLGPTAAKNGEDGLYFDSFSGLPASFSGGGSRIDTGTFREASKTPDIAIMTNGQSVIVWEDRPTQSSTEDIWMRIGANAPVRVNTTVAGAQVDPHVAALAMGGFVVTWLDQGAAGGANVRARVFTASGVATSTDFLVSDISKSGGAQWDPDVSALIDGRFIVTWGDQSNTSGIEGKIFDPRVTAINVTGGPTSEQFVGTSFNDTLRGALGNDTVLGHHGRDLINGGDGNDVLNGGSGNDTLYGAAGADDFVFANTLGLGNVDRVQDFATAQGDDIVLKQSVFAAIGSSLTASELRFGSSAADANDFVIYNSATGQLWYDRDGTGAAAKVLFAQLDSGTALSLGNFEIQI